MGKSNHLRPHLLEQVLRHEIILGKVLHLIIKLISHHHYGTMSDDGLLVCHFERGYVISMWDLIGCLL